MGCGQCGDAGDDVLADQADGGDGCLTVQHMEFRDVVIAMCDGKCANLGEIERIDGQNLSRGGEEYFEMVKIVRVFEFDVQLA